MKKLAISEFLISVSEYMQTAVNGEIHIIGDQARWGKITFSNSEIISLVYADHQGLNALSKMAKLSQIRVLYRPAPATEGQSRNNLLIDAQLSSEEFFSCFVQKYPDAVAKCMKTVKPRPLIDSHKNNKIMVIDDSAIARKMISRPLIEAGYSVIEAIDGFDGLGKIKIEPPSLIVIDLIMPGIDGYKVVDLLKQSKNFNQIPIIIVTSKDSLMDKLKGKMSSTEAYITKPFEDVELLDKINKFLH